ncbi:MAG: hypothetical protein AAGB06_03725 [Verrucomicrobiota bacterium]
MSGIDFVGEGLVFLIFFNRELLVFIFGHLGLVASNFVFECFALGFEASKSLFGLVESIPSRLFLAFDFLDFKRDCGEFLVDLVPLEFAGLKGEQLLHFGVDH